MAKEEHTGDQKDLGVLFGLARKATGDETETGDESENKNFLASGRITVVDARGHGASNGDESERIPVELLYRNPGRIVPTLPSAIDLLKNAEQCIIAARDAEQANDSDGHSIEADSHVQLFHRLMPELICCRDLGDGFGMIVFALFHGIANRKGIPINAEELSALGIIVRNLRRNPFVPVETAIDWLGPIEDLGFDLDPPEMAIVADLFNG